jgi:hypothetical protein
MVAQISSETFNRASLTPPMEASDSDDLVLALETARVLEAQGDIREAARWLRRAADQAEKDGNDARVLVLARAAADLTNTVTPSSSAPKPPSLPASNAGERSAVRVALPKPASVSHAAPAASRTPAPQASSRPPSAPAPVSQRVVSPPPVPSRIPSPRAVSGSSSAPNARPSAHPTTPPPSRAASAVSAARTAPPAHPGQATPTAVAMPESTPRGATLRVAVPASKQDASVFVVRRLEKGQPLPPGTTEATLVFATESELLK